jgi:hypothetical protein
MEQAKKDGNHKLFEDWRNVDPDKLTDAQHEHYLDAFDTSNEKYEAAWQGYLNRTMQKPEKIKEALEKTEKIFASKEKAVKKVQDSNLRRKLVERFKEKGKEEHLLGY